MIFSLNLQKDEFLEQAYKKSMEELNEFFGINWKRNTPLIIIVPNRGIIDILTKRKTEDWVIGWTDFHSDNLFLLDRKNFEKESCHKYSEEKYIALLKHELTHLFTKIFCNSHNIKPVWINEGLSIYLSGQNKFKKRPTEFTKFLTFCNHGGKEIYAESGFAVEFLIKKYGKEKFLTLLKELKNLKTEKKFKEKFQEVYGFELNYKNFKSSPSEG